MGCACIGAEAAVQVLKVWLGRSENPPTWFVSKDLIQSRQREPLPAANQKHRCMGAGASFPGSARKDVPWIQVVVQGASSHCAWDFVLCAVDGGHSDLFSSWVPRKPCEVGWGCRDPTLWLCRSSYACVSIFQGTMGVWEPKKAWRPWSEDRLKHGRGSVGHLPTNRTRCGTKPVGITE